MRRTRWLGVRATGEIVTGASEAEVYDAAHDLVWDGPESAAADSEVVRRARLREDPTLATDDELPDLAADLLRLGRTDDLTTELERRRASPPEREISLNRTTGALVAEEVTVPTPPSPPSPPADAVEIPPLHVRLWRSIWRTPPAYRWTALAILVVVSVLWVGSLVYEASQGGTAEPPPWSGSEVHTLTVCDPLDPAPWMDAAERWARAGWAVPDVSAAECTAAPPPGVVQIRTCGHIAEGLGTGCRDGWDGTAVLRGSPVSSGVVYVERFPERRCMRSHELGHVLGLGHTLAGSSVMAGDDETIPCGTEWRLLQRELYPEAP